MLFLDTFACNDIVDNHFGWATFGSVIAVSIYVTIIIHLYWRNVYKKRYLIKQLEEMQLLNGIMLERQRTMKRKTRPSSRTSLPTLDAWSSTAPQRSISTSCLLSLSMPHQKATTCTYITYVTASIST